jgi:hypothetical protein
MTASRRRGRRTRSRRGSGPDGDSARSRAPRAETQRPPVERRPDPRGPIPELCELSPFAIFCAFHLGITEQDGYAHPDRDAVARRFALSGEEVEAFLAEHGLDPDSLERAGFDVESARLDIQVAPEGISRVELARTLFEDLRKPADAKLA